MTTFPASDESTKKSRKPVERRAFSVQNVLDAKFNELEFEGIWEAAIGRPELTGSWMIYGPPKNGKTSFAIKLAKYLTNFEKVYYNSIEEGLSKSIQSAYIRMDMKDVAGKIILQQESVEMMYKRLKKNKSPNIIFLDSVQFAGIKFSEYKRLKEEFPNKIFIYISHVKGNQPQGETAIGIWRDSNVSFRVEGFRAFPISRYGGGDYINVSEEKATEYWVKE